MDAVGVMQVVDTLCAGGRERVAVNLANLMPRDRYRSFLCTTRADGPLADTVKRDVGRLCLRRRRTFEFRALYRLVAFIRHESIRILHAHDAAIFLANLASRFPPFPAIVWHDHCGPNAISERPVWHYRALARRVRGVLATSRELAHWSRYRLRIPRHRVRHAPNFVCISPPDGPEPELPGRAGRRIVCVASLRAVKDQLTLVRAMAIVVKRQPFAHLLLVGEPLEADYQFLVQEEIAANGLADNVTLLGRRLDVPAILRACDIGVLCSLAETSPLALLEYGEAGLPAVATDVGDCAELLEGDRMGVVLPPGRPKELAEALLSFLNSAERRAAFGRRLQQHVRTNYSAEAAVRRICLLYDCIVEHGDAVKGMDRP